MQRSNSLGGISPAVRFLLGSKVKTLSRIMTLLLYCKLPQRNLDTQVPAQKGKDGSEHDSSLVTKGQHSLT